VEDFLEAVFNRWLRQKPRRLAFPSTVVDEASVARKERLAKKREAEAKRHKMNKVKKSQEKPLKMQPASWSSSSSSSSSAAAAAEPEQDEQNEEQAQDYGWHEDQFDDDSVDSNMVGPNDMEDEDSQ
jgi:hypothetical protein